MARSTKDAWLRSGAGDLKTEEVSDVPEKGQSVLVRALPARYSAEISSQMKMTSEGNQQVARVDVAQMEILQFTHGVIEPQFTENEAKQIAENFGPAFRSVIEVIDRISGVDKEAVKAAEERFLDIEESPNGAAVEASAPAGGS